MGHLLGIILRTASLLRPVKLSMLMRPRPTAHSSSCSKKIAPTKRTITASLGRIESTVENFLTKWRLASVKELRQNKKILRRSDGI